MFLYAAKANYALQASMGHSEHSDKHSICVFSTHNNTFSECVVELWTSWLV